MAGGSLPASRARALLDRASPALARGLCAVRAPLRPVSDRGFTCSLPVRNVSPDLGSSVSCELVPLICNYRRLLE